MQTIKFYNSFRSIKKDWDSLYKITPEVSPFLHPDAMKIAVRYFYPYYIVWNCIPVFVVLRESNDPKAIIPLLRFKGGRYELFGNVNGFNESGALFDNIESLKKCINLLKLQIGSLYFEKIDERSPIKLLAPKEIRSIVNVAINFGMGYDAYFKGLSKSVRQNIRTAYNRLEKDGHKLGVNVYSKKYGSGEKLPVNKIIELYCGRHSQRYGGKSSVIKRWFLEHQNFATLFYKYSENALTVIITIDGSPAAFLSGLYEGDRLIVPRLSIKSEYNRYSPGMILVCETIKYLLANTEIGILDLSKGDEEYKYKLGGIEHLSYSFKL